MRSKLSGANGGRPRLPSGRYGDTSATNSAQGTTRSISSRNSRRLVRLAVIPRPRLCCFISQSSQLFSPSPSIRLGDLCRPSLGVLPDGSRDILGLWIENTEGAKFWLKVFNDLKTRGCNDILVAVTDGLKGMGEALGAVFPATALQTCIVHLIRNSLDFASWKDRKGLAAAIKPIYTAPSAEAAQAELDAFEQSVWGQKFPPVVAAWRRAWDKVIPFFAFPPEVRRVIYTTNAIESVNARLRKIIKTRGHFPSDDAATKLIWLAMRNITIDWGRAANNWKTAMNQFAIVYADRFKVSA